MRMEDEIAAQFGQLNIGDELVLDSHSSENMLEGQFAQSDQKGACNLIVNYLPHDIDDLALRSLFQEFGDILMTKVVRDKNTKKSMGYGFVKFSNEPDALAAIEKMNGYTIGHKNLKVSVARPPSLDIRNCKLYVTNLPKDYGEREVIALFKEFGDIIECRVLKDKVTKANKGVAFVQFNVKAQANNALSLNGCQLEGSSRGLVVKFAEDQYKKKELNRLHNLTLNNAFRGLPTMNSVLPAAKPQMEAKGGVMNPAFFYQQPGMYAATGSLLPQPGMFPQTSLAAPPPHPSSNPVYMSNNNPQGLDYLATNPSALHSNVNVLNSSLNAALMNNNLNRKAMKGRKPPQGFDASAMQNNNSNWYNAMPSSLPFMQNTSMAMTSSMPPQSHQSLDMSVFGHSPHLHGLPPHAMLTNQMAAASMAAGVGLPQAGVGSSHGRLGMPNIPPNMAFPTGKEIAEPGFVETAIAPAYASVVSLLISNLPGDADHTTVHQLFAPYGRILSVQIEDNGMNSRLSSGRAVKGSAPLRARLMMENIAHAEAAAQALNGAIIYEGTSPIQVQVSLPPPGQSRV